MIKLKEYAKQFNIDITDDMLDNFERYLVFLLEYNKAVNLTAITDPDEVLVKHFLDSILLLNVLNIKENATLIDIGTGAGFPGVPLKILRPDIKLTLLDSLNKRLVFIEELLDILQLEAKLLHARAEELARESPFRDGYDIVVSRAVSAMPALCEYCMPYSSVGGVFVAYKGSDYESELEISKSAIKKLGGKTQKVEEFTLPDGSKRALVVIEKNRETPAKYPRRGVKINKNPMK